MEEQKVKIICLTPVRNNACLLNRFLSAASLWADHIIICDQMSTDESRVIAKKYSKVILIDNPSEKYSESARQKLLINEARKIEGQRLLITLDADEIFTPNVITSTEWKTILSSRPGTIFKFQWANFRPDMKSMWFGAHFPWGLMDDGSPHEEDKIMHSYRIPLPSTKDIIYLNQIKVIHFQYTDWEKMQSKHRFYQCIETINFPRKSAINIYRTYHHMNNIPLNQIIPIPEDWINQYDRLGIDITSVYVETMNWFDQQGLNIIEEYGAVRFKKLNIWDINWQEKAILWGKPRVEIYNDPRKKLDKHINKWLKKSQKYHQKWIVRLIDRSIRFVFKY
jgi:hypothetical protein